MRWWNVSGSIGLIIFLSLIQYISSLSISVENVECVYEYALYEGDTISGNFVVLDHDIFWSSDHPGINFIVTAPGGNTVHTINGTSGDKFQFKSPRSGLYKFCFHNPYSTPETISFYIHVGHIPNDHDLAKDGLSPYEAILASLALSKHVDPINVKIAHLREALESVIMEQRFLKARDLRHRNTNESTRSRVIFYTISEYILLALASALQVVYIRRLFSTSVAYNRV